MFWQRWTCPRRAWEVAMQAIWNISSLLASHCLKLGWLSSYHFIFRQSIAIVASLVLLQSLMVRDLAFCISMAFFSDSLEGYIYGRLGRHFMDIHSHFLFHKSTTTWESDASMFSPTENGLQIENIKFARKKAIKTGSIRGALRHLRVRAERIIQGIKSHIQDRHTTFQKCYDLKRDDEIVDR